MFFPLLCVMLLAGVLGGVVNVVLRGQSERTDPWFWSIIAGVGAALLIPLFLEIVSSTLVSTLLKPTSFGELLKSDDKGASLLVFGGFCLLAAISSKAFIQTLSERVLREVREAKLTAERAEKLSTASSEKVTEVAALTENARDEARYGVGEGKGEEEVKKIKSAFPLIEPGARADDPWAGQFGGTARSHERELKADLLPEVDNPRVVIVRLTVQSTDATRPLAGSVQFYLHPTFKNRTPVVTVDRQGKAVLTLRTWGAFTVGALADGGETKLELDLSKHPDAREPWRSS